MAKVLLAVAALVGAVVGAGCTPGSGEYGSCASPADCQVSLQCVARDNGIDVSADGGYLDGGWCRYSCAVQQDCATYGEVCGDENASSGSGYCSKDGGY